MCLAMSRPRHEGTVPVHVLHDSPFLLTGWKERGRGDRRDSRCETACGGRAFPRRWWGEVGRLGGSPVLQEEGL